MRLISKEKSETTGSGMSENRRSSEREPFLFRLANAVDFVVGILTAEIAMVLLVLFAALILGASFVGILLEFVIGTAVLAAVAGLAYFASDDV
ncbi:hypothetical protein [Roseibium sediminicola]|uniref:Uncharacterized protein n=1 Tax=Roseibium sediminicola TaxID=2933272 RepID=A0ABT0GVW5_9HYPH|nr:hypothetical protein [Roseibium sp. CAU 1639]MCK7613576.1 hypothetical protein [Roseibium sp. CAU 1639]